MSQPHDPGEPLRDLSAAEWIEERLWPWGPGSGRSDLPVGSIVPDGFDAYARVLHPAYRETEQGLEAVRWSTVASWTGRVVHPKMQFLRIANLQWGEYPGWGLLPSQGSPQRAEAERLVAILRSFTTTPERCYFAVWEGFGVPELQAFASYPRVRVPHRAYFLFRGPLEAVPFLSFGDFSRAPNIWWPEDRAWCVASEIDLDETLVGGSSDSIGALLADPALETFPTSLNTAVDIDSDDING